MAKDKKGKGSCSKDACYHKVKSRYSVWPSAYASGALVKCRKVGAANWGNKSESFEIDPKKHKDAQKKQKMRNLAIGNENPNEKKVAEKKAGGPKMMGEGKYSDSETYVKGTAPVRATYGGKTESFPKETYKKKSKKVEVSEGDKYDNVGKQAARMSLLNNPGPRSTPEQSAAQKKRLEKKHGMKLDDHPQFKKEEVGEGYRVVSTSFKSGDGDPKDDVTIKKQKKVVSGDNLTKRGAERSANARRQEYGAGDAFQVQKTKTAKKRSSNAASEAEVKAKIDAKEKKQQKSRAQQSIAGMNRAGTPSGKVAAARLKTDKKFNKEEVDKRRAPKELLDRLNSRMVGWMADDGPNKPAYDAKQRLLKKAHEKRKRKGNETVDEANRLEKHLGMGSNTPENELSRMKRRASASGIGSEGPDGKPRENKDPGTIRMNRGVARMVHKRNRGKSPSDPTYKKRRGIDPHADMKSYRDSPLGLPKGYKDPLNSKSYTGHKVNSKVKIKERKPKQGSNKIVKFKMTEEIVRSILDEAGKKCWKGYKKAGTQKLFGKTYNRCVKANEELSIDQQMKISRDYNRMSPEEKKAANKKAMGNVKKVAPKKDTRTDAQKMTDATGPRPGSRYRGD